MAVRAKFRYTGYSATHISRQVEPDKLLTGVASADQRNHETVEARSLSFVPVYGHEPGSENRLFWNATPSGKIELQMVNPEAWRQFEMGEEYYVDFIPASSVSAQPTFEDRDPKSGLT